MNLIKIAQDLHDYLEHAGVRFSDEGFPIFSDDMLLKEMPEEVLPYEDKYKARNKKKTVLVFFSNDEYVYKHILNLERYIPIYKEYMGIAGFDISPRINWDIKLQKFNILLNMMADAYLAVNGVKILPNFRTGCLATATVLNNYPLNSWFAVGALGCARGYIKLNSMYLRTKLILTNPDMLIYYGKLKPEYADILDEFGIKHKVFTDFQRISRGKEIV